jgi:molybdate/tungstate transport system substrate-binding protein
VFESIGYAPIRLLMPRYTRWGIQFASSPLVIAYNPHSRYASVFSAVKDGKAPLSQAFRAMEQPGFRLGRTNPKTDPQGQAFYMMVELAAKQFGWPATTVSRILGQPDNPHQVYSEEGILSLLQAGGLDASSAFLSEAIERHLPYILLPNTLNFADPAEATWYHQASVSIGPHQVVRGAPLTVDITTVGPPSPAAIGFVRFVLSPRGQQLMRENGYSVFAPRILGQKRQVPQAILKGLR